MPAKSSGKKNALIAAPMRPPATVMPCTRLRIRVGASSTPSTPAPETRPGPVSATLKRPYTIKAIVGIAISEPCITAKMPSSTDPMKKPQTCSGLRPMRSRRKTDMSTEAGSTKTIWISSEKLTGPSPMLLAIRRAEENARVDDEVVDHPQQRSREDRMAMRGEHVAQAPLIRGGRDTGPAADIFDDTRSGSAIAGQAGEIARRLGHAAAEIKHG